jgi:hypothetical protein
MQKLVLLLLACGLLNTNRLCAQPEQNGVLSYLQTEKNNRRIVLNAGLQTALPLGEFAQDVPRPAYGVNLQLGYQLASMPLVFLGSLDMLIYGYQKSTKTIGTGQPQGFEVVVDRYQYMIPLHLHLRYAPEWGKFSPMAEVFGGMRLIASRTRALGNVLISSPNNPEAFSARIDYYDFTPSFGLGTGISYRLAELGSVNYNCSLYGRWMRGGKANYLSTDDLQVNGNTLIYNSRFNETHLVVIQLGFTALF